MPDYGVGKGPNDSRSHAEILMDNADAELPHPESECPRCGSEFVEDEHGVLNMKALNKWSCSNDSCDNYTYNWDYENGFGHNKDEKYRFSEDL
jgi:hypothetical protein